MKILDAKAKKLVGMVKHLKALKSALHLNARLKCWEKLVTEWVRLTLVYLPTSRKFLYKEVHYK